MTINHRYWRRRGRSEGDDLIATLDATPSCWTPSQTADVTVEIQVPEDTDIAVSPLTLTFTADTWNTPQTVTVIATQDDDAVADDPVIITHAVSGGDYQDVTAAEVEVTIIEDDTTGVTISITALEIQKAILDATRWCWTPSRQRM